MSVVESNCGFEGAKQFYCFDELFCNIVEGIKRFVELLPRIVILSKECRKQMFNCSKVFDKMCNSRLNFVTCFNSNHHKVHSSRFPTYPCLRRELCLNNNRKTFSRETKQSQQCVSTCNLNLEDVTYMLF